MGEAQKFMEKNSKIAEFKAYFKTRKRAAALWNQKLISIISESGEDLAKNETQVILIDKKHSVDSGVLVISNLIDQNIKWGVPYCKMHLVPEIQNEQMEGYPFSYEFIE